MSFKEMPPSMNTENSVMRESNLKGHKNIFLDQCQPQRHLQGPEEAGQAIRLCNFIQERRRWDPTNYFLCGVFDHS